MVDVASECGNYFRIGSGFVATPVYFMAFDLVRVTN